MIGLLICLLLILIFVTPVTIRADVRHVRSTDITLALRLWGVGPDLRWRIIGTRQGHRLLRLDRLGRGRSTPKPLTASGRTNMALIRPIMRAKHARRLFLSGISLQQLDIALAVSMDSAARTALISGIAQSLWRSLPCGWRRKARLQVRPDFLGRQGGAQARCMVFFHLGTLLVTAVMLLLSVALERMERPVHPAEEA